MATAETHDVVIRWQQQGQAAIAADTKKVSQSFSGLGSSLTKSLAGVSASVKKSLSGIAAQAKTAGTAMSVAVTGPLVLMGKQAISAASDLNESMSAVKTVFGDSAQSVIDFSRTAATNLGQSQNAALSMASQLGALFQSIGLNNQAMADWTTTLETASADLGSFFNADPSEVLDALKSGLVGEAEPLRKFGILLNDAAVQAEGVKEGLIQAGGTMTDQQKVMARYQIIMSQIGAAQGDFARTSDGLANSQRILSSEIQDLSADIGTLLLPYAKDLTNTLKNVIGWVKNLSPEAKDLGVKIALIAAAAGPVLAFLGTFGPALAALASGPFVVAAGAAVALYKAWDSNFLGIRDILQTFLGNVGTVVGRMVEFFSHAKDRGLDPFQLAIRTMIQGIKADLGADNPVSDFLKGILRNGERLTAYVTDTLIPAFGKLTSALTSGDVSGAADILGSIKDDLASGWDKTVGPWIDDQVGKAKAFAATIFQGVLTGFGQLNWDALKQTLTQSGSDLIDALRHGAQDAWNNQLAPFVATTSAFAQTIADNVLAGAKSANWQAIGDEVGTQLRDSLSGLDQFSDWVFNAITGAGGGGASPGLGGGGLAGGNLPSELGAWVRQQIQQVDWQGIHDEINKGMSGGNFIADFEGWANQQGIDLHTKIAAFVEGEISQINWQNANDALTTAGTNLLGQLLNGFGAAMTTISAWFSGTASQNQGGTSQGLGARISSMITGSFAQAANDLIAAGKYPFEQVLQGMQDEWQAILDWAATLNPADLLPKPPTSSDPNAPINSPDSSRNTRTTGGQAYGGLGGQWTWVGEKGPELVKLPTGAMVIPHGAAQTRAASESWQRLGQGWLDKTRTLRDVIFKILKLKAHEGDGTPESMVRRAQDLERKFLGGNNVTPENWEQLLNRYRDNFGDIVGGAREADHQRRSRDGHAGMVQAEDGSWVPASYYHSVHKMAYGGVADNEPRDYPGGRLYDKGRVWSDVLHRWVSQEHADRAAMRGGPTRRALGDGTLTSDASRNLARLRRGIVDSGRYDQNSYIAAHIDDPGAYSGAQRRTVHSYLDERAAAREERQQIHVYGNVTINPPNADVHAEISRQFQTRNR